jgi:hypothetical protein
MAETLSDYGSDWDTDVEQVLSDLLADLEQGFAAPLALNGIKEGPAGTKQLARLPNTTTAIHDVAIPEKFPDTFPLPEVATLLPCSGLSEHSEYR